MESRFTWIIIVILTQLWALNVAADNHEYRLLIGSSLTSFDSTMRLESELLDSREFIDFEDDLKFDRQVNLFLIKFETLLNQKHKLSVAYLPLHRDAYTTTTDSLTYQGDRIEFGSSVQSAFNINAIDLEYAYRLFDQPRFNLEIIGGIYWMETQLSLNAKGRIAMNGNEFEAEANYYNSTRTGAPLPLLGLATEINLNDFWRTSASIRYFKSSHNADENEIVSTILATEYDINDQWGIGASYSYFDADIYMEDTILDFDSDIRWKYQGANIYAFYRF